MSDMYTRQDPTKQYPKPPFPKQPQDAPGDENKMTPKPDAGEQTYVGRDRLPGARALVTGADSGIGRAVAIAFAREGADVALSYLEAEQDQAEQVAELIRAAGRVAVLVPGDIEDEQTSRQVVADAKKGLDGLDVLVLNAGVMPTVSSIGDFETKTLDHVLKTNVYPLFWMTQAAVPHMEPGSAVITTSSVQGFTPSPDLAEYAVSKGGIANWTRAMAEQLIEKGIRVNGVAPGPVWTPLQPAYTPDEKVENFGSQAPIGRPAQPVELAPAYVFLASQESSYVVGETIAVTGGMPVT